jgi:hypothetical protein
MTRQLCAHWFLQRKANEIVKRLAPNCMITPEILLKGDQTVSGADCPRGNSAPWEVRLNLPDDVKGDILVPMLNQAMLQLYKRYDLDPAASPYVAVGEPICRPAKRENSAAPALLNRETVAAGSPERIKRIGRIAVAKACKSKRAGSRRGQRQPSTTALRFATFDAPVGAQRFGFHRHRPIVSVVI